MPIKLSVLSFFLLLCSLDTKAQVTVTRNIDYISDSEYHNGKDLLDIYMPEDAKGVPVIVYFHGGALLMDNKNSGVNVGLKIAESGIGMVSANYRLSPEFQHPSHVNDAAAATSWVIKNIEAYGGDPTKVYVAGHSAGAYLAALVRIDSSLLEAEGTSISQLNGAILISPFLYVEETAKDRIELDSIYTTIWGNDPKQWEQASVTPHILPNRDNILLIYADGDDPWRKEQNKRFANAMTAMGNLNVFTKEMQNRNHSTLISAILNEDDMIVKWISDFVWKE